MIFTVTINPAVDKTIEISNFQVGKVNRSKIIRLDAGGKGINVSKMIHELGCKSKAVGFVAGNNGAFIRQYLDSLKIEHDFITIDGETRTNIKIVDPVNNTFTDINEEGPILNNDHISMIKQKIESEITNKDILILAGSVPNNVNPGIYRDIIKIAKDKGAKTILDADDDLFLEGIEAGPTMIKPNIHELERAFSRSLKNQEEIIVVAKEIISHGVEYVIVSLGAEGALYVEKKRAILARGIDVPVKSTVGAGDAMVAAFAISLDKDYDLKKAMRLATAASTATVMTEGTQVGKLEDIERLVEYVEITQV